MRAISRTAFSHWALPSTRVQVAQRYAGGENTPVCVGADEEECGLLKRGCDGEQAAVPVFNHSFSVIHTFQPEDSASLETLSQKPPYTCNTLRLQACVQVLPSWFPFQAPLLHVEPLLWPTSLQACIKPT